MSCNGEKKSLLFRSMVSAMLIDTGKIHAKIRFHESEIAKLNSILGAIEEFAADDAIPVNGNGRGRRASTAGNPLVEMLRNFVGSRHGINFTHADLKAALGNPDRPDRVRDAIQAVESEGLLEIIQKPMGRKAGIYRPIMKGSN